jgi:hypothetical protein
LNLTIDQLRAGLETLESIEKQDNPEDSHKESVTMAKSVALEQLPADSSVFDTALLELHLPTWLTSRPAYAALD